MLDRGRLLIVTESLGFGGTESHLLRTLPSLVVLGWEIAVFCLTRRGERAETLEQSGVYVAAAPPIAHDKRSTLLYPLHLAAASVKLHALMRNWVPQIVHFYLPGPYLLGAPVAMAAGVPIKLMSRRSLSDYQPRRHGVAGLERWLHRQMAAIIGNCQAVNDQLIGEGVPEHKIRLIYNGIEASGQIIERAAARARLGLEKDVLIGS